MSFLDINTIVFTVWSYPVSYIELVATLFGLVSVYLATKPNIFTWPTGIVNEFGFFILFFQVQLYADMLLQVYFFIVTLYGWYYWSAPKKERPIRQLAPVQRLHVLFLLLTGTIAVGLLTSKLHIIFPSIFSLPAAYPYVDAFTTVASIIAMVLLARKILESWVLWIAVDVVGIWLYINKSIMLIAVEYGLFLILASYGLIHWRGKIRA